MDIQLVRVTLKKKTKNKEKKEQTQNFEKRENKKRGLSLRILPLRNSFDDKTLHQVSSCNRPKTFCGFSMGRNQYWAGRVYDLCVYYMTGTPEGSTESGFMEKPGIEPATPGLQGIALIHYTTGAS